MKKSGITFIYRVGAIVGVLVSFLLASALLLDSFRIIQAFLVLPGTMIVTYRLFILSVAPAKKAVAKAIPRKGKAISFAASSSAVRKTNYVA